MTACVVSVHVAAAGGVPKLGVPAVRVTVDGVEGDRQRDLEYHGGPTRAVCVYAQECIDALAAEGHPIYPGSTGENLTLRGLEWASVQPGDRLEIGAVTLEITSYAPPCTTIAASFCDEHFVRISQKVHPGWSRVYARVLVAGQVHAGDPVRHISAGASAAS